MKHIVQYVKDVYARVDMSTQGHDIHGNKEAEVKHNAQWLLKHSQVNTQGSFQNG